MCIVCLGTAGMLSDDAGGENRLGFVPPVGSSGNEVVDDVNAILTNNDAMRWNSAFENGVAQVVTFRFYDWHNVPGTASQDEVELLDDTMPMNAAQRENMRRAIQEFEDASGLDFVELGTNDGRAMVSIHMVDGSIFGGWADFPSVDTTGGEFGKSDLIIDEAGNLDPGSLGYLIALHELGHAVGLKHSFMETGGNDTVLPAARDNSDVTVMSYTQGSRGNPDELRPLDREALRVLYGDDGATDGWTIEARRDFIVIEGTAQGEAINSVMAASRIEGKGGNDRIYGGGEGDMLMGGNGDDVLRGMLGADKIYGGKGNDRIMGDGRRNFLEDVFGDDEEKEVGNSLFGGAGNDRMFGGLGADVMKGGTGRDHLVGWQGADRIDGGHGNDELEGNRGRDVLNGGEGDDLLRGQLGNDTLNGGAGDDELSGGNGKDILRGNAGADDIKGGNGADILVGGAGADVMRGGWGADTFVLRPADAGTRDTILDFVEGDLLDMQALGIGAEDVTTEQMGRDLLVTAGDVDVLLKNVQAAAFDLEVDVLL